jgi:hypothetical protein
MHELRDRNVAVRLGSAVTAIERSENGSIVTRLSDGRNVTSEMLLFAAGRVGATDRLNLDAAGIAVDHRGRIAVDPVTLQTSVPHIYAAWRCDRLSQPRLDLDGAGTDRRLPCAGDGADGAARILSLRDLFGAGNFHHRLDRGRSADPAAFPTRSAWRAFAKPRAATSWG